MENITSSFVFETAGGNRVEVSRAQMENVRNRLWRDDIAQAGDNNELLIQQTSEKRKGQGVKENKENIFNDIDYFDDTADDFYDELVAETYPPKGKRTFQEISNYQNNKKQKTM